MVIRQEHGRQGTAVSKDYQKKTARTSTTATGRAATTVAGTGQPVPVLPDVVSVAMSEIAADVREGLLAIAVGAGLQVMAAMMVADVEALCGPKGWHDPDRAATRHGSEAGVGDAGRAAAAIAPPRGCGPPMGPESCRSPPTRRS